MRGFLLAAVSLIGLEIALKAPASRVSQALAWPGAWLERWVDPRTPLISARVPSASSSSSSGSSASSSSSSASNPLGDRVPKGYHIPGMPPGVTYAG